MPGPVPIMVPNEQGVAEVRRLLRRGARPIRGGQGVTVHDSDEAVTITAIPPPPREPTQPFDRRFLAEITGHDTLANSSALIYRWKYAFREVQLSGDSVVEVTGGITGATDDGYAINIAEVAHTSTYVWGVDVTHADYPANFAPRAVGGGGAADTHRVNAVVWMTETIEADATVRYTFDAQGSHDGAC